MNVVWDATACALVEITKCALSGINEVWVSAPHEAEHVSNKEMSNILKLVS